jgi:hypothetical protein
MVTLFKKHSTENVQTQTNPVNINLNEPSSSPVSNEIDAENPFSELIRLKKEEQTLKSEKIEVTRAKEKTELKTIEEDSKEQKSTNETTSESPSSILIRLRKEEQTLLEEKLRLVDSKEKMDLKLAEAVKARQLRISSLKEEIFALENSVKDLNTAVETTTK